VVVESIMRYVPEAPFPAVLLDAPCTATGTLRRHPDIMWSKGFSDIATMARMQRQLLDKSAACVAPGGRLVYAVCSMEPEEGPQVVDGFLAANPDFSRLPIRLDETGFACNEAGDLRTHPALLADAGGLDGFYIARLGRAA
jgi:16S rRNA (cytosine967-C5)-methyltransferase